MTFVQHATMTILISHVYFDIMPTWLFQIYKKANDLVSATA